MEGRKEGRKEGSLTTTSVGEDVEALELMHGLWRCKAVKQLWEGVWPYLSKYAYPKTYLDKAVKNTLTLWADRCS